MKKPMLPIGVSSFEKLVRHKDSEGNGYLFVDKTMFIKDFIDAGDEISLITRPRRFGKTINMSMLQHFFAKEVNGIETKGLFDGLEISKCPEVMVYQGDYPVIFLTLKEIRGKNFEQAFERIKEILSNLFKTHRNLLTESDLLGEEKFTIERIINQEAPQSKYESSLQFLCNLLYRHTGKKAIILLDEYDTPLHDAYVNNYYEEMRSLISTMFNKAFKGNAFLYKAIITGILKIAKSNLFSELSNVKDYTILSSPKFAQYFGFTEEETDDYLQRAKLPKKAHQLKEMYNGYQIEEYILFNPFSIVNFIDEAIAYHPKDIEKALKPYWVNSGGNAIIKDLIYSNLSKLEPELTKLINKVPIKSPINEDIILGSNLKVDPVSFWSLLLLAGYLKPINKEINQMGGYTCELLFSNEEIRISFKQFILEAIAEGNSYSYTLAMESLTNGNIEEFKIFFEDYLRYAPSYFDTTDRYKEQFYHGMVLGMASSLSHSHKIESNRISGEGRFDIALQPKVKSKSGIILELKATDKIENLKKAADAALKQIESKDYKRNMERDGIKKFIFVGISFNRSKMALSYKKNY